MVIQLESVVLEKVSGLRKVMPKIRKFAFQEIGEFYVRDIFKKHFRPSARQEYQHQARDEKYLKRKRFIGIGQGKRDDLVFSGRSRRFMSHGVKIKATSTGVTIRMNAPLYFRSQFPGQPDKVAEVLRVSAIDRKLIGRKLEGRIKRLVKRAQKSVVARKVATAARLAAQPRDSKGRFL